MKKEKGHIISDNYIKTALLEFYGHFGDIHGSIKLFNEIDDDHKDIVTFNAMINAYGKNGELDKAKQIFHQIGHRVTARTYIILKQTISRRGYPHKSSSNSEKPLAVSSFCTVSNWIK